MLSEEGAAHECGMLDILDEGLCRVKLEGKKVVRHEIDELLVPFLEGLVLVLENLFNELFSVQAFGLPGGFSKGIRGGRIGIRIFTSVVGVSSLLLVEDVHGVEERL